MPTTLAAPLARPQPDVRTFRVRQPAPVPASGEGGEDWLQRWCEATSFEERLNGINTLSRKRLPSHMAAEVWLHLMNKTAGQVTPAQLELMLRQFIMLAPEHGKASVMYDLLMNGRSAGQDDASIVFMITSCARYLAQARTREARPGGARRASVHPGGRRSHAFGDATVDDGDRGEAPRARTPTKP